MHRHGRNDRGSAWYCEAFVVSIDRMRNQLVERNTGLRIEVSANEEFPWRAIAAVELELVRTIVRQTSVSVSRASSEGRTTK